MKKISLIMVVTLFTIFSFAKEHHFKVKFNGKHCYYKGSKIYCETRITEGKNKYVTRYIFNRAQFKRAFSGNVSAFIGKNVTFTLILTKGTPPKNSGSGITRFLSGGRTLSLNVWSSKLISVLDSKYKIKKEFSHKRYNRHIYVYTKTLRKEKGYITFYTYKTKKVNGVKVRAALKYYISSKDELFSEYGSFSKLKRSGKRISTYFSCRKEKIRVRDAMGGYRLIGKFWGRTFSPDVHGGRKPR